MASQRAVQTRTGARVTLSLQMHNLGSWGDECSVKQVHQQAVEAANGRLTKILKGQDCEVVGKATVDVVTTQVGQGATPLPRPAENTPWQEAERIHDMPRVHEALQAFSNDSTGNNAVGVVAAVIEALRGEQDECGR